ncbi:MAG: type II toxin-antitoxin system VapC family toxin [Treponema sp.]|nr:type II toxin-antitoxin system VapC family toxin [Treponema sp.]
MKLLLDTHALLWWWSASSRLSSRVLALLRDPENAVLVSAGSAWEISTKTRIGELPSGGRIMAQWDERIAADDFEELPMTAAHCLKAGSLPGEHRDPFDRMLAAQSLLEGIPVVTADPAISALGAQTIWA